MHRPYHYRKWDCDECWKLLTKHIERPNETQLEVENRAKKTQSEVENRAKMPTETQSTTKLNAQAMSLQKATHTERTGKKPHRITDKQLQIHVHPTWYFKQNRTKMTNTKNIEKPSQNHGQAMFILI